MANERDLPVPTSVNPLSFEVDLDILNKSIEERVLSLASSGKGDKRKATFVVVMGAIMSATTTCLLGMSKFIPEFEIELQISALIISSALTILLTWDKLFNHKRLWVMSMISLREFYELRDDIRHAIATKTLTSSVLVDFYLKYKQILLNRNQAWDSIRSTD